MLQRMSYKYENIPIETIRTLAEAKSSLRPTQQQNYNSKKVSQHHVAPCRFSMHPSNQAQSYMNIYCQRFHAQIYSIEQKISVFRRDISRKVQQQSKYSVTLCNQKVTKQGRMCGFSARLIETSAFAMFMHCANWYHKATAPISTALFTLCQTK